MPNVKFLYEGIEGATLTASGGTSAGYNIEDVKDRNPNTLWVSSTQDLTQTFKAILPASRNVDTIIIDGINGSALGINSGFTLKIKSSPNGTVWTDRYTFNAAAVNGKTRLVCEIASANAQQWMLEFNDTDTSLAAAPQIGSILLGTRFEPATPYDEIPKHGEQFTTTFSRALDSTPYGSQNINDGIEIWKNIQWQRVTGATRLAFLTMGHTCRGKLRPLYFIDVDGTSYLVYLPDKIEEQHVMYDQYTISLELEAFSPGTIKLT
jgi:hypothetical protein